MRAAHPVSLDCIPNQAACARCVGRPPRADRSRSDQAKGLLPGQLSGKRVLACSLLAAGRPDDLDVEVADLLAQGVSVQTEQFGGLDLIATGGSQRRPDQRFLDIAQDPVIQPRWRQVALELAEIEVTGAARPRRLSGSSPFIASLREPNADEAGSASSASISGSVIVSCG